MKVAHLTTIDLSLRYLVFPQLEAVIELGGEAVGISAPGPWVDDLEAQGIRHIQIESSTRGMNPIADLKAAVQLWRILQSEKFDVLHTHNPKPGLYGRVLGRLAGVPIVVNTVHGLYATPDDPLVKRAIVYSLEAVASRFSDEELVQNPEDLALLHRWRISPRSRMSLLGNGVDLERFAPGRFDASHRDRLRQELGVSDTQIVVGIVGRLVAEKGYPELFEAMRLLDERYVLVCIGPHDRDKADALSNSVIRRATADGVRFLGMRTDVDALYPAMDLFVLPSHREGYPRAAMEAAASGLAVVATDIRGCRQVVEDGVTGLLVPVGDPAGLAGAIRRLGDDPVIRSRMSDAARARARAEFDEGQVVQRVMDAYERVARRKGLVELLGLDTEDPVVIRRAIDEDAAFLARMHSRAIETGFLPRLGHRFMMLLYRTLISWPAAVVLVAEVGGVPVGFAAGVADTGLFYRHFRRHHAARAVFASLPALSRPSILAGAWETLRYEGARSSVAAELLAMAVSSQARRRGIGARLGSEFLSVLRQPEVKVVVGAGNGGAIAAYEKVGFEQVGSVEVHAGEASVELVWSASS